MLFKVLILATAIVSIMAQGSRVWTIGYGHDWGGHEYFDQSGYIRGFSQELIAAVCEAGNMDCQTMWSPYQWCWNSDPATHSYGGQGIVDSWVDACIGWFKTIDRIHVFNFSLPYQTPSSSYLFIKPGSTFDSSDMAGKKIAFVQGWQADEKCLARQQSPERQNYILSADQIVYVDGVEGMINAVLSGQVDAAFNGYTGMAGAVLDGRVDYVESFPIECALTGASLMTRKDNDFNTYWNVGFQAIQASGKFAEICANAEEAHGSKGAINCIS